MLHQHGTLISRIYEHFTSSSAHCALQAPRRALLWALACCACCALAAAADTAQEATTAATSPLAVDAVTVKDPPMRLTGDTPRQEDAGEDADNDDEDEGADEEDEGADDRRAMAVEATAPDGSTTAAAAAPGPTKPSSTTTAQAVASSTLAASSTASSSTMPAATSATAAPQADQQGERDDDNGGNMPASTSKSVKISVSMVTGGAGREAEISVTAPTATSSATVVPSTEKVKLAGMATGSVTMRRARAARLYLHSARQERGICWLTSQEISLSSRAEWRYT